ncbi:MAG: LacI family transcriptional regulator [Halanaerobiales bacterium]|nr:LacI family transcriptional regulator [Halanaerobiales bacterium]
MNRDLTMKDIAERAGVSVATVSRVLNNTKPVSSELKKKVLDIVKETGYKPNALARSLIKQRTGTIGVIIPDMDNETFADLIKGIELITDRNDHVILVTNTMGEVKKELEMFNLFEEKRLDGIIFSGVSLTEKHIDFFEKYKIPTVLVGQTFNKLDFPSVTIDNFQASFDITEYLIELGHQNIGMIRGPLYDIQAGKERLLGYKTALRENDYPVNNDFIIEGDFTITSGYKAMEEIWSNELKPTAIFSASDKMAIGALNYCLDHGLKVPEDVSIAGFDDMELATAVRPALTTIHQDQVEKGIKTADILLDLIEKEEKESYNIQLPYSLIERDSTCARK